MIRSRAELAAMLLRAARGEGLPLALAEDSCAMAPFVSTEEVAWLTQDILNAGSRVMALTTDLDRIACGEVVADLPPIAEAMAAARGWRLEHGRKTHPPQKPQRDPLCVPEDIWSALEHSAAKTYVPDTDASRTHGAGAGAIDND